VLFAVLRFAQLYDIDLSEEFHRKMIENERKYPVEKARGSNKKYDEL
jgi:NTP pyrophosphatase (non-canonical NTP hydrolase)